MEGRNEYLPAYYRLAEDIREKIESGELKPGDAIPPANRLAEVYGVSLMTVRQGLTILVRMGYLKSVQGKGTFVTAPSAGTLILPFSDKHLLGQDKEVKVKLLNLEIPAADEIVADRLAIKKGTKVIKVKRLLYADEGPVAVDFRFLPYIKGMPLLEKEIAYAAFPEVIAQYREIFLVQSSLEIYACTIRCEEAELLEVEEGHPALCLEQLIRLKDGRPVGWSRMMARGDRLTLKATSRTG
ncbi:Transcription regulator HTH, GntR [Moorella glycerini]|uniref:Mannosyl-D-glycerate transport/metabolism system repressor MngR n=1 Tax=Neomoorella stamsii TaxID=1266720 RepID=A0A9X7J1L6_9FIRM|nr:MULTISPECIES: GntR family transcriptional regulator [Moorella]PRR71549.1 Mannosyl-D-glycerate transport/metabolism system repressor MngR [Moorella stamsii]CEP66582.1 Transcription regulator HTH, GntR [Moorella glycerini]